MTDKQQIDYSFLRFHQEGTTENCTSLFHDSNVDSSWRKCPPLSKYMKKLHWEQLMHLKTNEFCQEHKPKRLPLFTCVSSLFDGGFADCHLKDNDGLMQEIQRKSDVTSQHVPNLSTLTHYLNCFSFQMHHRAPETNIWRQNFMLFSA